MSTSVSMAAMVVQTTSTGVGCRSSVTDNGCTILDHDLYIRHSTQYPYFVFLKLHLASSIMVAFRLTRIVAKSKSTHITLTRQEQHYYRSANVDGFKGDRFSLVCQTARQLN